MYILNCNRNCVIIFVFKCLLVCYNLFLFFLGYRIFVVFSIDIGDEYDIDIEDLIFLFLLCL